MALCTVAFTLCAGIHSRRSPSDEGLAAVPTGSQRPFAGDVSVQAFLAEGAAASGIIGDPVPVSCRQAAPCLPRRMLQAARQLRFLGIGILQKINEIAEFLIIK